jgi:cystathionine beta-lyase/cystathionine gamma-synthase
MQLLDDRVYLGTRPGTMESWLLLRSLRTLHLRVPQQSQNATKLVAYVVQKNYSIIRKIAHASLQEEGYVKTQLSGGYPPCFALYFTSQEQAKTFCSKTKLFRHATSLGGAESLCEWRAMSDATVDRTLVRISVGIEGIDDLIKDFDQAIQEAISAEK